MVGSIAAVDMVVLDKSLSDEALLNEAPSDEAPSDEAPSDEAPLNEALSTVTQVAHRLNAHPHSIRRWADSGLLYCYRIGFRGDRRFNADDVDAFLIARVDGSNTC